MGRITISTSPRLKFETWAADDFDDLFDLHSDPRVQTSYGPSPEKWTKAGIRARLDGYIGEQRLLGLTKWKVSLLDGTFIGRAGWSPWGPQTLEIGYAFKPEFWNCGYGIEAARAVTTWAVTNRSNDRLVGFALTHNTASRHILERIGMSFVDYRDIAGVENAYYEM
ncbi:MAG: GNAT family N-acetyltransferase [Candidatus Sphingomonas colombiensis]|nr:GNAT family N-acetyltransferase [Sphingomonas sp.]WEK41657.1 MAG: GNAT family N-acetyltransferase [Sphingomonas sp.]